MSGKGNGERSVIWTHCEESVETCMHRGHSVYELFLGRNSIMREARRRDAEAGAELVC